jgi:uracil phosphoribosyltransferase
MDGICAFVVFCAGRALVESVSRVAKSASSGTVSPSRLEGGGRWKVFVVIVPRKKWLWVFLGAVNDARADLTT